MYPAASAAHGLVSVIINLTAARARYRPFIITHNNLYRARAVYDGNDDDGGTTTKAGDVNPRGRSGSRASVPLPRRYAANTTAYVCVCKTVCV